MWGGEQVLLAEARRASEAEHLYMRLKGGHGRRLDSLPQLASGAIPWALLT